jgi:hypothetical protein
VDNTPDAFCLFFPSPPHKNCELGTILKCGNHPFNYIL